MLQTKITTPVLFLVFNRPQKTQQVFDVIKRAKPSKLYVAADAPRNNIETDLENCKRVREIVSIIDWDCEVKYLFHNDNLGCSLAGITAWNWLFSQEEEMIFLEDDGLVSISFFSYCQELLEKYRYQNNIAYIGGVNYGMNYGESSYFFSKAPAATYSMATWKRVYDLYEPQLKTFSETFQTKKFKKSFVNNISYQVFVDKCKHFLKFGGNTYDLQMIYLVEKYNMSSIYPNINLSSNIGLDFGGANNNVDPNSLISKKLGNRERFEILQIVHPERIEINPKFEKEHYRLRFFYDDSWFKVTFNYYGVKFLRPFYRRTLKKLLVK